MAKKELASEGEVDALRRLATDPKRVQVTARANYDMWGKGLTKFDVCDALHSWIKEGRPVTRTQMHQRGPGVIGYEIKPELSGMVFYMKFIIRGESALDPVLLIVSAHKDEG